MTLNLHSGGELVPYDMLRQMQTPPATASHVPVEHYRLVDLVRGTLSMYGHEIVEEHHAIDHEGQRYFGLMTLKSTYGNYTDTLGLRNSHDKSFLIGVAFGSRVFVCSNLSFIGDHVIRRKHTARSKRELPGLLMEIIEPLAAQRERQALTFNRYKEALLTDEQADHAIMTLWREGVINTQRIPVVAGEWDTPRFDEFKEKPSAFRLFNAATFALEGRVAERPDLTSKLHTVIDAVIN